MFQALKFQIGTFLMVLCFISGDQIAHAAPNQKAPNNYNCTRLIQFLDNYFSTAIWLYDANKKIYSVAINEQLPVGFTGAGNLYTTTGANYPENTNPNLTFIQLNPNKKPGCLYQIGNPALLGNNDKNFMLYAIE